MKCQVFGFLQVKASFRVAAFLILTLGTFCSVFDLIYIWLLARMKPARTTV